MTNKYISRDTLDDFFREIGEKEEIDLLAQQKTHNNTRKPLTAACHASETGWNSETASKGCYGASQAAKAT